MRFLTMFRRGRDSGCNYGLILSRAHSRIFFFITLQIILPAKSGGPEGMKSREMLKQHAHKIYTGVKRLPGISALINTTAWQILRFKIALLTSRRRNCHFTSFLRMPTQFEALSGPVLDFLFKDGGMKALKVTVMGCSIGAEAYSIASVLRSSHPDLAFTVHAYDIDKGCIDKARSARYTTEEVLNNEMLPSDFISSTFDREDGHYVIKGEIRERVQFDLADVLDLNLKEQVGTSDIVYAQHFLIHLEREQARKGIENICGLLNPRAALFISGTVLDMLVKLTRKNNLIPCDYNVEEIHKEAGVYGRGWPYIYFGCEPFMTVRKDWQRRYATIFFRI